MKNSHPRERCAVPLCARDLGYSEICQSDVWRGRVAHGRVPRVHQIFPQSNDDWPRVVSQEKVADCV